MTQPGEAEGDDERRERVEEPPESLLAQLQAEPGRAPELIALAAAERFATPARRYAQRGRARGHSAEEVARHAVRRHTRLARAEGAVLGVGGAVTAAADLVGLARIQSRMVFVVAAAHGYDPGDPMRPAELLVLFELYDDPVVARQALDGTGKALSRAMVERSISRPGDDDALGARLAKMALKRGTKRLAGRFVPVVAVAVNAVGNERATRALGDDAIRFYGG